MWNLVIAFGMRKFTEYRKYLPQKSKVMLKVGSSGYEGEKLELEKSCKIIDVITSSGFICARRILSCEYPLALMNEEALTEFTKEYAKRLRTDSKPPSVHTLLQWRIECLGNTEI
eukprot:snap_masked-scaffold_25-processed-gene-0.24-mRNA-1 protein AED:1.00 eAED:1.00 QI:0/0/0/0/1/1/2/0/114